MTNAVIGRPRWTDDATFSGGSWEADYPVTNAGILPLSRVARSTDLLTASTQFSFTLTARRPLRTVALVRHNLSLNAQMRVRLYSDAGMTATIFDSGWEDVWPVVYPLEGLEWEDDNWWTGKYTAADIANSRPTRPIWLGQIYLARAGTIEISDATNAAGYVEVGLCELTQGWVLGINPGYGAEYGFRFRTEVTESLGGISYFDTRDKPRVFRGNIDHMDRDEVLSRGYELQRRADLDGVFLWFPHPDEPLHWLRNVFLARNKDPGLMRYASFEQDSFPISLEEVL
jgi:hypothetical protein